MKEDWVEASLPDVCEIQTGKYDANHAKQNGKYKFFTCAFESLKCDTNRFKGGMIKRVNRE
ncbi:MAG TPA: restriction endonuclease subunit S [Smithellaceae bacterium]|jgi:type I restriction enzyme S subunit|nr:restriction endonuclease subunit S [Smithellaceae bacterium]HRS39300.1 restriction endonuclease subunit S [Bacteroidia bacterium]